MENQSISAHVVVISPSGGKLSETKANSLPDAESGSDFANLLAAQIQGDTKALVIPDTENAAPVTLDDGEKVAKEAVQALGQDAIAATSNPQSADQLINTLNSLQFTPVQNLQPDVHLKVIAESDNLSVATLENGLVSQSSVAPADLALGTEQVAKVAADPAREAIDPAKIAVTDKTLPNDAFRDIKSETNNISPASSLNLAQVNRTTPLPTSAAPVAPPAIEVPVGHAGWDAAFSQRVAWVATNTQQVAHLQLNPPNLGPLEIRINLSSDQANAAFTSPHAAVRDAIEAALPRLREMLADNGLSLGNVNVSSQSFQQQQQQSQSGQGQNQRYDPFQELNRITTSGSSAGFVAQGIGSISHTNNGLVDIFA